MSLPVNVPIPLWISFQNIQWTYIPGDLNLLSLWKQMRPLAGHTLLGKLGDKATAESIKEKGMLTGRRLMLRQIQGGKLEIQAEHFHLWTKLRCPEKRETEREHQLGLGWTQRVQLTDGNQRGNANMRKKRGVGRDVLQVGLFCLSGRIGGCSQEQLLWDSESTTLGKRRGETLDFNSTWCSEIESRCHCHKCITNPKGKFGARMTSNYLELRHMAWVFTFSPLHPHSTITSSWKGDVSDCDGDILQPGHSWKGTQQRYQPPLPRAGEMSVSILKGLRGMGWASQHLPHTPRDRTQPT